MAEPFHGCKIRASASSFDWLRSNLDIPLYAASHMCVVILSGGGEKGKTFPSGRRGNSLLPLPGDSIVRGSLETGWILVIVIDRVEFTVTFQKARKVEAVKQAKESTSIVL